MKVLLCTAILALLPSIAQARCPSVGQAPDPIPISIAQGTQWVPHAVGVDGGAIVAWRDLRPRGEGIYAQRINPAGKALWRVDGVLVGNEKTWGVMSDAVLAPDEEGGAFVAWIGEPFAGLRDWTVRIQRLDANGVALWGPNGIELGQASGDGPLVTYLPHPSISADGLGGAVVAWQAAFPGAGAGGRRGIYSQRVDAMGKVLWTPEGVRSSGDTGRPSIASVGDGSTFIAWWDDRNEIVRAQHLAADGTVTWDSLGIELATMLAGQPIAISDGDGGVVVVWCGGPVDNFDVFAHHLSASADRLWGPTGVRVCGAADIQAFVTAATDGSGGTLIAWQDWRSGFDYDVYAQRIAADGHPMWVANGVPVCVAPDQQTTIDIVPDLRGGALIGWTDTRDGYPVPHIYAQAVDAWGVTRWAKDGLRIASSGVYPVIAQLTPGRALIAWMDGPSHSSLNVYGQVLTKDGALGPASSLEESTDSEGQSDEDLGEFTISQLDFSGRINVHLLSQGTATLAAFDLSGRKVASYEIGAVRSERTFELGRNLVNGVYFLRIQQGRSTVSRRVVLLR